MSEFLTGRSEDYLRGLYRIVEQKGYARIKDVAKELGVQPSSAVEMMKKLDSKGLVDYEKYGGVTLTGEGEEIAKAVRKRHKTFRKFLEIILVPREIAAKDAHVLEHRLDPKTILQFTRFVDFITSAPNHPKFVGRWIEQFRRYCENKAAQQGS
ncbi:metal-dependent transcriptional regulator [Candidatus Bathyarchaeota archaeon]|nr:metal-dependent transcriptional regulator [Candidatus Bathyarchaeota archaeon]NIU81271.1 metal-dependent transcriptional regulator [Candidatus Bathyarchaeota archaeon]NIV67492.1 metal-dependent transcriptional regulator [Candidatus Bathyarchaeota archaeon]NIW16194.1 metal-dependent transcriptional regulator [Candidatus Bathyarchaeota archaeon]NIW34723.1 metal-dependent transcriptional regulator [Candidatus Bathyarchaeota archaeon]